MTSADGRGAPTSERVHAEYARCSAADHLIYLFHLATYDFARRYTANARVLDFGCGTGYGAHRIAPASTSVTGVDVSGEAVDYARAHYVADNLRFATIDPVERSPLPFADADFDVVLSFQVIEHVPDADRYLAEARRVLAQGGVLVVATPDRTRRLFRHQRPWNRYHVVEYTPAQLLARLEGHFRVLEVNGMGADPAVLSPELRRNRQARWATLPFTFPGTPERWRQWGLTAVKTAQERLGGGAGSGQEMPVAFDLDETAIRIAPDVEPSVNIVAVARRT